MVTLAFVDVRSGIIEHALHALERPLDVGLRDGIAFGQGVGEHDRVLAAEGVQDAVVHVSSSGSELVDAVAQLVRLRPAQLVPELGQPVDPGDALLMAARISPAQLAEPLPDRRTAIGVLIEDDACDRQVMPLQFIALLV
jgi:hypothetical protein